MSMMLLRMLAKEQLPLTVVDRGRIDLLRRLDGAGYVKAFIPAVHVDCDNRARQDPAVVIEITARGRQALFESIAREAEQAILEPLASERPQKAEPGEGSLARLLGGMLSSHG